MFSTIWNFLKSILGLKQKKSCVSSDEFSYSLKQTRAASLFTQSKKVKMMVPDYYR
jgi:hypothetical protein